MTITSTLAFTSLASAISGLGMISLAFSQAIPHKAGFLVVPAEIFAIIIGHSARRRVQSTGDDGDGLALAGLTIGYGFFALIILLVIAFIFYFPGMLLLFARSSDSTGSAY